MRFMIIAALALPVVLGASAAVNANDAHHPEKQAQAKSKAKSTQKAGTPQKAVRKPVNETPVKKSGPG